MKIKQRGDAAFISLVIHNVASGDTVKIND